MRALLQRVNSAHVDIDNATVGRVGIGLLVFVCAVPGDDEDVAAKLAAKIAKLRIFQDDEGRMNRSVRDVSGGALVVSQFTLAADTSRGNRPGFSGAAAPKHAEHLYERFCVYLADEGVPIETGSFGAEMVVHIDNDGPVTIWLDSEAP